MATTRPGSGPDALSFPVIGAGIALQRWGLAVGGVGFGIVVGVLAVAALGLLLREQKRVAGGR